MSGQDKDTVSYKVGILVDFEDVNINQVGLKYRTSRDLSLSLRARVTSSRTTTQRDFRSALRQLDTYILTVGIEYRIIKYSDFSLFPALSVGLNKTKSKNPFYYYYPSRSGYTYENSSGYFIQAGVGCEYYLLDHLSLSAYELSQIEFSRDESTDEDGKDSTTSSTSYYLAYSRLTITFYF